MIQKFIIQKSHPRLLLFFAGWGADETPFKAYLPAKCDYMICYDYRTLDFDISLINQYQEIHIVGWSMGVWAATQVLSQQANKCLPIRSSVAINGTPYPVDEQRGIPPVIYQGTLEGLAGVSLHKFLRRMCLNGGAFKAFLEITPRRPLEELREELIEIEQMYHTLPPPSFQWKKAIIGSNDRIIPPSNQKQAWEEDCFKDADSFQLHETTDAHYQVELFAHYLQNVWTKN